LLYQKDFFEQSKIPSCQHANQSLHIDGQLFSKFIIEKFKDQLTIHDDVVIDVIKKNNSQEIDYLKLKNNETLSADFYIDSSGFAKVLFKHLENEWIDRSDWCPIDSCIPSPVFLNHETIPIYTTAEASTDGWILNVPLQHRWGTGYLFSSKFTDKQTAIDRFSAWTKNKFNQELNNDRVISFTSGYWKKQWIGNCIAIGLSGGFAEPLEATNIHQVVYQIKLIELQVLAIHAIQ
jgi:tryptophan halogenase